MTRTSPKSLRTLFIQVLIILLATILPVSSLLAAPTKIMCLGDSITGSPGCWRALLWQKLTNNGYTNIDFVGTLPAQGCGFTYDGENEGHGGYLVTNVANQNLLPAWLSATNPDIVIMHFGTNDVWNGYTPATITAAYTTLVNQMRANNPNMKILVAQIIPMNPPTCANCAQGVINLNATIPGWASGLSTSQSPIVVVDQWTGFSTATDTYDGVHPNDTGIVKISDKWYPSLVAMLSGTSTTAPTRTVTATTVTRTATRTAKATTLTRTATRTATTGTASRTATITATTGTASRTATGTATATSSGTGCTCDAGCSTITTITPNFSKDGAGQFCYSASSLGNYINSWNLTNLKVNGVEFANKWTAKASLPAAIGGLYYVYYNSTVAWGHFEAMN